MPCTSRATSVRSNWSTFSILSSKLLLSLLLKIYPVVTLIFDRTSWCEGILESSIGNPTVILSNSVFASPSTSEAEI